MVGIINGCEVKKWFLRINYNCKNYKYNKEYLGNFYFIHFEVFLGLFAIILAVAVCKIFC